MLNENIKKLVEYGIETGLTPECERIYTTNLLLEMFHEDSYEDVEVEKIPVDDDGEGLEQVLSELLAEAVKRGIIEDSIGYRDLFDTKLMNALMPRPSAFCQGQPRYRRNSGSTMDILRRRRQHIIINSAGTVTTSAATG